MSARSGFDKGIVIASVAKQSQRDRHAPLSGARDDRVLAKTE